MYFYTTLNNDSFSPSAFENNIDDLVNSDLWYSSQVKNRAQSYFEKKEFLYLCDKRIVKFNQEQAIRLEKRKVF